MMHHHFICRRSQHGGIQPKRKKIWVDYLVNFKWILVIFVVLPLSFTFYFMTYMGDVWSKRKSFKRRQKEHDENVEKVIKRLKERNPSKDNLVCTARKPYIVVGMRNVDYKRARYFKVDLSDFRNIVEIDTEKMIARGEPLVNMGQITRVTMPMNLALTVVAALDDLTVGGLINAYGIAGSSHIYGLFSDTVVAYEVVLADGRLVKATQGEAIRNYYHEMYVIQDMLVPLYKVADALEFQHREMEIYPIWLCPHRLFKLPVKTTFYPEPGFEEAHRQGDIEYAQMYIDIGIYYTPTCVFRGEAFYGAEAVRRMAKWLIENNGFQPQYVVSELNERDFWRMFDGSLYNSCREKYRALGTFMNVYYKSKKGRTTEKEVQEEEQKQLDNAYVELDQPVME